MSDIHSPTTVILCDGEFPNHSVPLTVLKNAKILICADGSANAALKVGRIPDLIIGDMDSISGFEEFNKVNIVKNEDQNSSDLEKAVDWCVNNKVPKVSIVGATGKREDHTLANHQILMKYSHAIEMQLVTDHFTISYLDREKRFDSHAGQKISILPLYRNPVVSTHGLKYSIENILLEFGARGISNSALGSSFTVSVVEGGALVFIAHPE